MARRKQPSIETFATGVNLRWDVRWVIKHKHRWHVVVKDCGDDLSKALSLYQRVSAAGRHHVTLRCKNSGFPPPPELRPYWAQKRIARDVPVGHRGKTKTVVQFKQVYRSPMRKLNRVEGKWWCPYCRELREFVHGYELPFVHPHHPVVGDLTPTEPGLYCPMCLVGTSDRNVRRWNPLAERF
jgi:hypothetical protein